MGERERERDRRAYAYSHLNTYTYHSFGLACTRLAIREDRCIVAFDGPFEHGQDIVEALFLAHVIHGGFHLEAARKAAAGFIGVEQIDGTVVVFDCKCEGAITFEYFPVQKGAEASHCTDGAGGAGSVHG